MINKKYNLVERTGYPPKPSVFSYNNVERPEEQLYPYAMITMPVNKDCDREGVVDD